MKKYILLVLSFLCLSMPLMAQRKAQKLKGAHPYKVAENKKVAPGFSHLSITPHVGFNSFDGDFNSEMKTNVAIPNAGLDLEYSFNPVWGLGLSYMYDMYTVTGKPGLHNADTLLNGHMHKAGLYVSMDFIGLFYPNAKKKILGVQAIFGGGYAWYKSTIMYHDDPTSNPTWVRGQTINYINEDGDHAPSYDKTYNGQLYLQAGMNVEFNLNRTLALGVRATYNYFINDYIDGRGYAGMNAVASKNNDGIVDVTLNMRFKLNAVSKTHVRNISSYAALASMQPKKDKEKEKVEPKCVHDTVIIRHDSIIVRERIVEKTTAAAAREYDKLFYVYFDNNKSQLDDRGLITIQQVADRLAEDPGLYAVVTGFCDNTGSAKLNYALGDKRAENVISELEEEHGVASDHLYSTGMGKLVGRRSQAAYGPNRRAVIRLVDKATFDRMKADLEEKRANRNLDEEDDGVYRGEIGERPTTSQILEQERPQTVKTVPLEESARPKKVNELKQRGGEIITTEPSTTLSKLARKYYNNTYCWVYIYIANKDKIKNPNNLVPGTDLIIPELTEQEMRITKDQGLVLYGNARQER
ncbi:MAG: OmpA family protein [Paludibacteraceae bacterium]|nr:OmpA family protein [Paludibacteraceae bacterium]